MGHIVDVLGRAGEMNELAAALKRRSRHLLLEEILDSLDVVICGALNLLDALSILERNIFGNCAKSLALGRSKGLALGYRFVVAKRLKPDALHKNAPLDKAIFGKYFLKLFTLVAVAPIDGADCRQCILCHIEIPQMIVFAVL